jgi:hypothetical protein
MVTVTLFIEDYQEDLGVFKYIPKIKKGLN